MPIEDRNLAVGTRLVASYKGEHFSATVVAREKDKIGFTSDGHEGVFKSLSELGGLITGGSVNGWKFWSVEGQEPVKKTRESKRAEARRDIRAHAAAAKPQVEDGRTPLERADAEGGHRWEEANTCSECRGPLRDESNNDEYHTRAFPDAPVCCVCSGHEIPAKQRVKAQRSVGSGGHDFSGAIAAANAGIAAGENAGQRAQARKSVRRKR